MPENPSVRTIDIGISESDRRAIADGLSRVLADSYTLYLKTHNYHWNVKGPMFNTLHLMFEQQYNELSLAVDQVAERIRALGHPAPGSYASYTKLTAIPGRRRSATSRGNDCELVGRARNRRAHRARGVSRRGPGWR